MSYKGPSIIMFAGAFQHEGRTHYLPALPWRMKLCPLEDVNVSLNIESS